MRTPALEEFHIGCSGWFYWGWRGKFYPLTAPTHKWFPYYAEHFKTVELNAPFYSWPKRSTVQCWIRQAPAGFLYSIKVNRYITHGFRMEGTAMLVEQFYLDVGEALGERMACFLFQFPPSFRYTKKRLAAICKQLDPRYRNVVEFRHKSWWNDEVYAASRRLGLSSAPVAGPTFLTNLSAPLTRSTYAFTARSAGIGTTIPMKNSRLGGQDNGERRKTGVGILQ